MPGSLDRPRAAPRGLGRDPRHHPCRHRSPDRSPTPTEAETAAIRRSPRSGKRHRRLQRVLLAGRRRRRSGLDQPRCSRLERRRACDRPRHRPVLRESRRHRIDGDRAGPPIESRHRTASTSFLLRHGRSRGDADADHGGSTGDARGRLRPRTDRGRRHPPRGRRHPRHVGGRRHHAQEPGPVPRDDRRANERIHEWASTRPGIRVFPSRACRCCSSRTTIEVDGTALGDAERADCSRRSTRPTVGGLIVMVDRLVDLMRDDDALGRAVMTTDTTS